MKLDLHFPVPIWHDKLDINNDAIFNFCKKIQQMDPEGRRFSNYGGWQSKDIRYRGHIELFKLENAITSRASSILYSDLLYPQELKLDIGNLWININNRGDHNLLHTHPRSKLSGVYYVKAPKDCGDIVFPRDQYETYIYDAPEKSDLTKPLVSYTPEDGMLYLFGGHTQHYVHASRTDEERISIAFNIQLI